GAVGLGGNGAVLRPRTLPAEQRLQAPTVENAADLRSRARLDAARVVEDRRRDVRVRDDLRGRGGLRSGAVCGGDADRVRHLQGRLVRIGLAPRDPVLAEEVAVVGEVE